MEKQEFGREVVTKKNETEEGALYKLKFKKNKFSIYIDIYFYYCDL